MTKQEFENMACATVTAEEYKIIEKVYTWHPAIRNTDGKGGRRTGCIYLSGTCGRTESLCTPEDQ